MSSSPQLTPDAGVRRAGPSDVEVIARTQLGAWSLSLGADAVAGLDVESVVASWHRAVTHPPDRRHHVLVATQAGAVVGFAAIAPLVPTAPVGASPVAEGWTAQILALEVAAGHQRKGHGSRLLAAAVDLAEGAHHLQAWALDGDAAREGFLTGAGLAQAGVRRTLDVAGRHRSELLWTAALGAAPVND